MHQVCETSHDLTASPLKTSRRIPYYWSADCHGHSAIEKYLAHTDLNPFELAAIRTYLRKWIDAACTLNPQLIPLRHLLPSIVSALQLESWLTDAYAIGVDPL
jgi:hypothetical protein